jgi:hypothetical protein
VIESFIKFIERNIGRGTSSINLEEWKGNTRVKITEGINVLLEKEKIALETDDGITKIVMPNFYNDIIEKEYMLIQDQRKFPFPSEETLEIKIPPAKVRVIRVEKDFINYLSEDHKSPHQIIKLVFPENFGSALTLESMYPAKMLEFAVVKLQEALHQRSEMDFFTQRLTSRIKDHEARVKDFLSAILMRPAECIANIRMADEFTSSAWNFFCPLAYAHIRELIGRYNEESPTDYSAIIQASTIISAYNNFYLAECISKKQKETALSAVETKLSEYPYAFTIGDMLNFKTPGGTPILQRYTTTDLEEFLHKKTSSTGTKDLPSLLRFTGRDGMHWYIKKDKVFTLCTRLLVEARNQIKTDIEERWAKLLYAYKHEDSMERSADFEDLLIRTANLYTPLLIPVVRDKKTALLQTEVLMSKGVLPRNENFFDRDRPVSLQTLLILKREDLLRRAKFALPFWYSIKPLVAFMRYMKFGRKKQSNNASGNGAAAGKTDENRGKLRESAIKLSRTLVPDGTTIDEYLDSLNDKWNQKLNLNEQRKLREDVNTIVRGYIQQVYKNQFSTLLTVYMLDDIAENIVRNTSAFSKINNKNALRLYIKIYIAKHLSAAKAPA